MVNYSMQNVVVQEQLEKMAGKKQKKIEDEAEEEIERVLSGKVPPPSKMTTALQLNRPFL